MHLLVTLLLCLSWYWSTPALAALCTGGLVGCECHVLGNYRAVNCEKRDITHIDTRGTDSHEYITYGYNRISEIPDDAFSVFPLMRSLNISHNFISEVGARTFHGVEYLEWLDLSFNKLSLVPYSIHPDFLQNVQWLSLEGNRDIGKGLKRMKASLDNDTATWINSNKLRNISLANCDLERLPAWMVRGLTSLESLDVSQNKLVVLPLLTVVSMCRLRVVSLRSNKWSCSNCENYRTLTYTTERSIRDYQGYKFCPTAVEQLDCSTSLFFDEETVRNNCLSVPVPEKLVYNPPHSFWFFIGIVAGCIVGLVLLSVVCNSIFSAVCKKRRTNTTKPFQEHELMQVLEK